MNPEGPLAPTKMKNAAIRPRVQEFGLTVLESPEPRRNGSSVVADEAVGTQVGSTAGGVTGGAPIDSLNPETGIGVTRAATDRATALPTSGG